MSLRRNKYFTLYLLLIFFSFNEINSIQIRLENRGAYIARVLVRYQNSKNQGQLSNSGGLSSFQSATINIDNSVKSIEIDIQMYVFFNSLRTIVKTTNPCPHTRCFVTWGTVFKAEWNELCCE
ncbi:hypothetical protein I4U23_026775 [Adineta vaga]|nr:hypothetical protein I4U23_026775 [Adineta vaga]